MKQWKRKAGWLAAGAGWVALALWLCGCHHSTPEGSQAETEAGKGTNSVQTAGKRGARPNPGAPGARRGFRPGGPPGPGGPAVAGGARGGPREAALQAEAKARAARSNAVALARARLRGTNVLPAAAESSGKTGSGFLDTLRRIQAIPYFYQMVGAAVLGLVLGIRYWVRKSQAAKEAALAPGGVPSVAARLAQRKTSAATVYTCNVLRVAPEARAVWNFGLKNGAFALNREQASATGEPLPLGLVAKDWRSLFQRKLNIAWLPPEHVFLRVAHFPPSDFNETVAMVELQLERLSPMPVTQIVWSLQVLPQARAAQQTVILLIVARSVVEEFLGRLEGQGFMADRLELPMLDQLQATPIGGDGVWIYAGAGGSKETALAAWWYGGVLQNLDLLTLPKANQPEAVKEQLMQMAWAGEMEGWVTSQPRWHLVADAAGAAEWEPVLRTALEQPVAVSEPLPASQLAALTATRATQAELQANLLPLEYSTRYQQQFVDRLWMGGLGAVIGAYIVGVAIYLVALEVALIRTRAVESTVADLGPAYTNALQFKARYTVLKDRQDLKYAALDCWKAIAESLPESITLDGFSFRDGKGLSINGSSSSDQQAQVLDFEKAMTRSMLDDQPLFDVAKSGNLEMHANPGNQTLVWSMSFDLKRAEK